MTKNDAHRIGEAVKCVHFITIFQNTWHLIRRILSHCLHILFSRKIKALFFYRMPSSHDCLKFNKTWPSVNYFCSKDSDGNPRFPSTHSAEFAKYHCSLESNSTYTLNIGIVKLLIDFATLPLILANIGILSPASGRIWWEDSSSVPCRVRYKTFDRF